MADYDAFGRKTGENPLEQLGSSPTPVPAPSSVPSSDPPRQRRSRAVPLGVIALMLIVLASVGAGAALLAGGGETAQVPAEAPTAFPAEPETEEPETADRPARKRPARRPPARKRPARTRPQTPVAGLQPGSLLRPAELARAVRALRSRELGEPVSFRVEAERIDTQLKTRDGRLRMMQVRRSESPNQISITPPGFGSVQTFPWSAIRAGAPQRLVRAAAERAGRSAADVNYLVLMTLPKPTWGVFFKDGTHFQGDAAGRITRRVS